MSTYNINRQITTTGLTAMTVAATAATAAIYYRSATMKNNNKPKCAILVFPDQEGLQPNAISLRYDRVELDKLQFLKKSISTELGTDESNLGNDENSRSIRLFVQATKEEIRNDSDWKSALLSRGEDHELSEIVLISTTDGKELSKVAREQQQPLQHFLYTRNIRNLPILGQKLVYSGDDELPLRNAYTNLFTTSDGQLEEVKTVLIHRPTNDASGCYERYNIDYIPANEYGVVQTIDPDLLTVARACLRRRRPMIHGKPDTGCYRNFSTPLRLGITSRSSWTRPNRSYDKWQSLVVMVRLKMRMIG